MLAAVISLSKASVQSTLRVAEPSSFPSPLLKNSFFLVRLATPTSCPASFLLNLLQTDCLQKGSPSMQALPIPSGCKSREAAKCGCAGYENATSGFFHSAGTHGRRKQNSLNSHLFQAEEIREFFLRSHQVAGINARRRAA